MKKISAVKLTDNKEKNLEILKKFYQEIWANMNGEESKINYVKNDIDLYNKFKEKNIEQHCESLNKYYSTRISRPHIEEIAKILKAKLEKNDALEVDDLISEVKKICSKRYTSFFSKYCHWHYEVRDASKTNPISDTYVRYGLIYYGIIYHYIDRANFPKLEEAIDDFIETYLPQNIKNKKIELSVYRDDKQLPNQISIYRLIDKFLWLQYKIHNGEIEGDTKTKYEQFIADL